MTPLAGTESVPTKTDLLGNIFAGLKSRGSLDQSFQNRKTPGLCKNYEAKEYNLEKRHTE